MEILKLLVKTDLPGNARLTTAQVKTKDGTYQATSVFHGGWPTGCRNATWTCEADAIVGHTDLVWRAQNPNAAAR